MSKRRYLLDTNVLIALTVEDHEHHETVNAWFTEGAPKDWGICPFTESGFLRVMSNPRVGGHTLNEAIAVLQHLAALRGYRFWEISESWTALTASFRSRLFGHQQVTDAELLGLAIQQDGILVTLDVGLKFMAGEEYGRNVLLLT